MSLNILCVFLISSLAFSCGEDYDVQPGSEVKIQTLKYPRAGRPGDKQIWNLKAEVGKQVQIVCDTISIGPSEGCLESYIEINNGEKIEKFCGSRSGLAIRSKNNKMTVIFELIKMAGIINCGATAVVPNPVEPQHSPEGNIALNIGESYDQIFFSNLPSGLNKNWEFSTTNAKIGVTCRQKFSEPCTDAFLTIGGEKVCTSSNYTVISSANKLNIELKTKRGGGMVDCLVQSVGGIYVDYYRNVGSVEIDSSEHGVLPGKKSTSCKCGWSKKQTNRIVNGKDVTTGEYPWMVALKTSNDGHFCGGSIISEYHILTAAHCTKDKEISEITVTVGSVNRITDGEDFEIASIREHFYSSWDYHVNDAAIITLKRKITFNETVGPVCLSPVIPNLENQYITVMGWGYLDDISYIHPEVLQKAHMKVVNYKTCSWHWFRRFQQQQNRLCTWANNKDSCKGDSGSPLVWLDPETNRYTQVGLVSFGRGCNTEFPKVNTLVPQYNEWIQKEVSQHGGDAVTCRKIG